MRAFAAGAVLLLGLAIAAPAAACLNDFEIEMAERQLVGAYATPATPRPGGPSIPDLLLVLSGGAALAAGLWWAGKAA